MNPSQKKSPKESANKILIVGSLLSLTLGLAPFYPEPHIWGKLQWVAGGAVGMQPLDYFDLLLHGAPWLVLIYGLALSVRVGLNQ